MGAVGKNYKYSIYREFYCTHSNRTWGLIMSNVEQPKYQIISSDGPIQLRTYNPLIVAEVKMQGERQQAIYAGFRLLADYIFGNNKANNKIAMTEPVTQQEGQKIAMTAPVTQQSNGDEWSVHFTMPSKYTMDTLPQPNNKAVILKEIPAKSYIVIKFSGLATKNNITKQEKKLQDYVREKKINTIGKPIYAFFNPPWTIPFLRRNEIMWELVQ